MQNILDILIEKNKIKNIFVGILLVAGIIYLIIFTNNNKGYNFIKSGKFDLSKAMQTAQDEYGLSSSDNTSTNNKSKDYFNNDNNNLTNDLTYSVVMTNLYLDKANLSSTTTKNEAINEIYSNYKQLAKGKKYSESDLKIIKQESQEDIKSYTKNTQDEIILMQKSLSNTKKTVQNTINIYQKTLDDLLAMNVPSSATQLHLRLINLLSMDVSYLNSLTKLDSDPMIYLLIGGGDYNKYSTSEFVSILKSFREYFISKGIK